MSKAPPSLAIWSARCTDLKSYCALAVSSIFFMLDFLVVLWTPSSPVAEAALQPCSPGARGERRRREERREERRGGEERRSTGERRGEVGRRGEERRGEESETD